MRRTQIWKKLVSTLMIGAMLCTEVPVLASDFSDSMDVSIAQEAAENVEQEEPDGESPDVAVEEDPFTDMEDAEVDFSDEGEADTADVAVEQEPTEVSGETEEDFEDHQETTVEAVGQTEDEDNLLGGGTVVE